MDYVGAYELIKHNKMKREFFDSHRLKQPRTNNFFDCSSPDESLTS